MEWLLDTFPGDYSLVATIINCLLIAITIMIIGVIIDLLFTQVKLLLDSPWRKK